MDFGGGPDRGWGFAVRQEGSVGISSPGILAADDLQAFDPTAWHTVTVDIHTDNWLQVLLDGSPVASVLIPDAPVGAVGLAARGAAVWVDDFTIWSDEVLDR